MQRVVLIGANGQLGSDLVLAMQAAGISEFECFPFKHTDLEVCAAAAVQEALTRLKPDVVINTAAYHRVDDCEDNAEKAFQVNALAVRNLALVCRDIDATLVHMSTDYVFGGDGERQTPYTEDDAPQPLNVYGASKVAGEHFVRHYCPKHFVVRTSGLYGIAGSSGKGGNFVELMLRLAREGKPIRVVDDQRLTPTYTMDLAQKILELIRTDHYNLYHVTSSGDCSWYEFAAKIFDLAGLTPLLSATTTASFGAKATRPTYSVLDKAQLKRQGLGLLRSWPEALAAYLQERVQKTSG